MTDEIGVLTNHALTISEVRYPVVVLLASNYTLGLSFSRFSSLLLEADRAFNASGRRTTILLRLHSLSNSAL